MLDLTQWNFQVLILSRVLGYWPARSGFRAGRFISSRTGGAVGVALFAVGLLAFEKPRVEILSPIANDLRRDLDMRKSARPPPETERARFDLENLRGLWVAQEVIIDCVSLHKS